MKKLLFKISIDISIYRPSFLKDGNDTQTFRVNVRLHRFGAKFPGTFPDISRPEPIGFYSVNESREFENNAKNLRFLWLPSPSEMPLDLNAGIENVQRKSIDPDYFDIYHICQFIYNHQEHLRTSSTGQMELLADFVTFRGVLRQIMCTPYQRNRDYRLMATCLNGTTYISKVETSDQRSQAMQMTRREMDMCSWGFKFEQYCTTPHPDKPPVTNAPVNESQEFACVYRSKLNGLRLIYGAEMDCIKSDVYVDLKDPEQLRLAEFVELKTSAYKMTQRQQQTFVNYKSLNWWSQSFLVGIDTIITGLRDDNGLVHDIKEYSVRELHRHKPWSSAATGTFLSNFLHELKAIMHRINDSNAVVMIDYKPALNKIKYSVLRGPDVKPILPEWYRQMMQGSSISIAGSV
ncbi:PREDICTED: decapping nuclease DXO homolog [Drosophila arizonae]|uniref:Decapping nuclease n=1 Tax=Drosophila arizonae TaxID=7263 RepID=A0ABM1PPJ4_DROAR|nr:PREDICTED: decapping nuclease DXO homolog [Drosophila arizonae]